MRWWPTQPCSLTHVAKRFCLQSLHRPQAYRHFLFLLLHLSSMLQNTETSSRPPTAINAVRLVRYSGVTPQQVISVVQARAKWKLAPVQDSRATRRPAWIFPIVQSDP